MYAIVNSKYKFVYGYLNSNLIAVSKYDFMCATDNCVHMYLALKEIKQIFEAKFRSAYIRIEIRNKICLHRNHVGRC